MSRWGEVKFSKILRGVAHKEGAGGLTDLDFFWRGAGKVKRSEVSISG